MANPARAPEAESTKTRVAETSVENMVVQESVWVFFRLLGVGREARGGQGRRGRTGKTGSEMRGE